MLIRIGDEKRELIDAHLGVLKNKFADLINQNEPTMLEEAITTLRQVIENMPHKGLIYASLLALMATTDSAKTEGVFIKVAQSALNESLIEAQDGFKSRNIFRWLAYLINLKALSASAFCTSMINLLK